MEAAHGNVSHLKTFWWFVPFKYRRTCEVDDARASSWISHLEDDGF
jgi:hypothetical protein